MAHYNSINQNSVRDIKIFSSIHIHPKIADTCDITLLYSYRKLLLLNHMGMTISL